MFRKEGFTILEMIVVMIIIGIAAAYCIPNFTAPTEQALASTAQNNLLAIYSAEQNYKNNNGGYCLSGNTTATATCTTTTPADSTCGDSLAQLNCSLNLNIQNDGSYTYKCAPTGTEPYACTATRTTSTTNQGITVNLGVPIVLTGEVNPSCTLTTNLCP